MTRKRTDSAPVFNVKEDSVLVKKVSGSSAPLLEVQDSNGDVFFAVGSTGIVTIVPTTTAVTIDTIISIDTFALATYRSAEFIIQVTQSTKYTTLKALVLHDGSNAQLVQYGLIEIGSPIIPLTISADISGSDVRLRATITDAASTNATVKVVKILVAV